MEEKIKLASITTVLQSLKLQLKYLFRFMSSNRLNLLLSNTDGAIPMTRIYFEPKDPDESIKDISYNSKRRFGHLTMKLVNTKVNAISINFDGNKDYNSRLASCHIRRNKAFYFRDNKKVFGSVLIDSFVVHNYSGDNLLNKPFFNTRSI